jgi:hypothetical protein
MEVLMGEENDRRDRPDSGQPGGSAGRINEVNRVTGTGGEPQPQLAAGDVEVSHDQWKAFLDSFSRQHEAWLVTVEIICPIGRLIAIQERPLKGISLDSANGKERAYVQVGEHPEEHILHTIDKPTRVTFKQSSTGRHQGLEIASADGTTTAIRFRSAMFPEMLDGIAA